MKQEQIIIAIPQVYCNYKKLYMEPDAKYLGSHFHTAIEVVYVKKGSILCNFENRTLRICENHFLILGSNVTHSLSYDNNPAQICYLQINIAKIIGLIYQELADIPFVLNHAEKEYLLFDQGNSHYGLLERIFHDMEEQDAYFELGCMGDLLHLISFLQKEAVIPDFKNNLGI